MNQLVIQHHPKRVRHLKILLKLLDLNQVGYYSVVEDVFNSASGMRKCFRSIEDKFDHLIVLQDDALPSKDLLQVCNKLVEARPTDFISLYSDNEHITDAVKTKRKWLDINVAWGLVGYIIPTELAHLYLDTEHKIRDVYADDVKMSVFLREVKQRVYCTAPSLVDHLCWYETTQNESRILKHRVANFFIGLENSGLAYDWSDLNSLPITVARDERNFLK